MFTCLNWPLGKAIKFNERAWSRPTFCRTNDMMARQQGVILIMFILCCMFSLIMDCGCVDSESVSEVVDGNGSNGWKNAPKDKNGKQRYGKKVIFVHRLRKY